MRYTHSSRFAVVPSSETEVAAGVTKAAAVQSMRDRLERNRLNPHYSGYGPDERPWTLSEVDRESFSHQVELAGTETVAQAAEEVL